MQVLTTTVRGKLEEHKLKENGQQGRMEKREKGRVNERKTCEGDVEMRRRDCRIRAPRREGKDCGRGFLQLEGAASNKERRKMRAGIEERRNRQKGCNLAAERTQILQREGSKNTIEEGQNRNRGGNEILKGFGAADGSQQP